MVLLKPRPKVPLGRETRKGCAEISPIEPDKYSAARTTALNAVNVRGQRNSRGGGRPSPGLLPEPRE